MKLVLLRHGPTDWNAEKRIQGQTDLYLSRAGIQRVLKCSLPREFRQIVWYTSPLVRARQTAELMGIIDPFVELALTEMDWGDWEGKILKPLRKQLGDEMRDNEARGVDFCPPNGESPRQVQNRVMGWLKKIARQNKDCGAVVHKGIIRCVYAMATSWDMRGESPIQFHWNQSHVFQLSGRGGLENSYHSVELDRRDTSDG